MDKPNEASAFVAVLLAFLGFADLTAASLSEQISLEYWLSNVPVRLIFLFGLAGYIYTFKDDGIFGSQSLLRQVKPGDLLRNSLVFSWAFMETAAWFWVSYLRLWLVLSTRTDLHKVFLGLREERREQARRRVEKLKAEEDRL